MHRCLAAACRAVEHDIGVIGIASSVCDDEAAAWASCTRASLGLAQAITVGRLDEVALLCSIRKPLGSSCHTHLPHLHEGNIAALSFQSDTLTPENLYQPETICVTGVKVVLVTVLLECPHTIHQH